MNLTIINYFQIFGRLNFTIFLSLNFSVGSIHSPCTNTPWGKYVSILPPSSIHASISINFFNFEKFFFLLPPPKSSLLTERSSSHRIHQMGFQLNQPGHTRANPMFSQEQDSSRAQKLLI